MRKRATQQVRRSRTRATATSTISIWAGSRPRSVCPSAGKEAYMFGSALVPLATLLAVAPVNPPEGSWLGWHGCWRTVGENVPEQVLCMLPGANPSEVRLHIVEQGAVT